MGQPNADRDWLLGKHIELYSYLLRGAEMPDSEKTKLQEGFHRFAFEYWLLSQTNLSASSPWWRYQIRQMLHREAKNQIYFGDPAAILPYFESGKLVSSIAIPPVFGLNLAGLTETNYVALVKGFQKSFFDATNVFLLNPVPIASVIVSGQTEDHLAIAASVGGKKWTLLARDKLPIRYQKNPLTAFQLFSSAGKVYYLPAFLRMCESDFEAVPSLSRKLADEIITDSLQSKEWSAMLSIKQRLCLKAFFEDYFKNEPDGLVLIEKLQGAL
jgi:hypothetical protein